MCIKDQNKKVLSIDIIINVMDEMRMERKIKMVLQDLGVDEYVRTDITDIDMKSIADDPTKIDKSDFDTHT
jgi:hypothetical protein